MINGIILKIIDNKSGIHGEQSFEGIIEVDRVIGTKGEKFFKIIFDETGTVWTTYPVRTP